MHSWTYSFSDYMISVLAAVIGVIGVSITGYIFMTESIRSLGDSDPYKKSVADRSRSRIYSYLVAILLLSIATVALCVVCYQTGEAIDDLADIFAVLVSILFTYILVMSIWLDMRMMNFNGGLENNAEYRLGVLKTLFNTKPLVIRVDSEEYNNLVAKRKTGNMEDFTENHDISFNIPSNTGSGNSDVTTIPLESSGFRLKNRVRDQSEYNQIFYIIHGYDDNILFTDKKESWFPRRHSYILNRWSIIGYCDIHDEFDVYDVFHVFECIESILCKAIDTDAPVINKSEHSKLGSALSKNTPYRVEAGMVDDIISLYFIIKEFRDNYMVRFENDYNSICPKSTEFDELPTVRSGPGECVGLVNYKTSDRKLSSKVEERIARAQTHLSKSDSTDRLSYMQAVSPFVFLLRYELSKKLAGTRIAAVNLNGYDFSYGDLEGTILRGSMLADTMLYETNLKKADLAKCDLSGAVFDHCTAYSVDFGESVFSNTLVEKTPLEGSIFDRASITGSVFPNLNMKGCSFADASIVNTAFENSRLTNSLFRGARLIESKVHNCLLSDSGMSGISISESIIDDCDLSGADFGSASVSTSTIRNGTFIRALFNNADLTSDLIVGSDFSNALCANVNFTGTQILSANFDSASINNANFTHTYVGPYGLDPESEWPSRDDKLFDEYDRVKQKLMTIERAKGGSDGNLSFLCGMATGKQDLQGDVLAHISSFTNTLAQSCIFSDAELFQCRMHGALLNHSGFTNTRIIRCCFQNASLVGTVFTDVLAEKCSFTNASFDTAQISNTRFSECTLHNVSFAGTSITQCAIADSDMADTSFAESSIINCRFSNLENIGASIFRGTLINLTLDDCEVCGRRMTGFFDTVEDLKREYEKGRSAKGASE